MFFVTSEYPPYLSTVGDQHGVKLTKIHSEKCADNNVACVNRVTQVLGQGGIDANSIMNNQEAYMASLHRSGI